MIQKTQNNIETLKKWAPTILITGFVLLKIQDLFLPYFWDEAWSYVPAIKAMVKNGPSLLPNSISPELYRGHPLFFYFINSAWIKLLGSEIWITKLFSLFITIGLLFSVYSFTRKNFDSQIAIITLIILMIQSVLFAQSTFLLPEILLTLFTILILGAYIEKKYFLTMLLLILALYTKESAIIIWFTIFFFEVIEVIKSKDKNYFNFIYLLIPPLFVAFFFIAQKLIVGWFFFPEHLAYINLNTFFGKLNGYASYLFIFMGRNLLTLFGLAALIFLLIRRDHALFEKKKVLYIISFFIISYLLFSSFNFYSPRYLLSILPFSIMIWVFLIRSAVRKYNIAITIIIFTIIIINNLYFTINKRGGDDNTLGYRGLIHVQQEMVSYCEEDSLYRKNIYTNFLMINDLTNNDLGYLKSDSTFYNVSSNLTSNTQYAIISSNELDKPIYEEIKEKGKLIKRFEQNGSWTELYQLNNH